MRHGRYRDRSNHSSWRIPDPVTANAWFRVILGARSERRCDPRPPGARIARIVRLPPALTAGDEFRQRDLLAAGIVDGDAVEPDADVEFTRIEALLLGELEHMR